MVHTTRTWSDAFRFLSSARQVSSTCASSVRSRPRKQRLSTSFHLPKSEELTMQTKNSTRRLLCHLVALVALSCVFTAQTGYAQTAGGTAIENSANATFTDSDGHVFAAVSNTVTVTVANVSG